MARKRRMSKAAKAAARRTREMLSITDTIVLVVEGAIFLFGKPNNQLLFKNMADQSVFDRLKSGEYDKIPGTIGAVYSSINNAGLAFGTPIGARFLKKRLPKIKFFGLVKT